MVNNVSWQPSVVTKEQRSKQKKQSSYIVWFTGLSGSGKSTLANALDNVLYERGLHTYLLDGDNLRHGLNQDLGFTEADRTENIRRVGEVGKLFSGSGLIVLAAFISPFERDRSFIKELMGEENVIEVYLDTPLSVCEGRDSKGLYKKARAGEIVGFTGIDSPYEIPKTADIIINTDIVSVELSVKIILEYLVLFNILSDQ